MTNQYQELRISNGIMNDEEALRERIDNEGYLFFKRLQKPEKMMELRRQMLTVMQEHGWLIAGTDPSDGIADISMQCTEGDVEYSNVYHQVYRLEEFHRSAHWPEVMEMMEKILGESVLPHPHKVARLWFPKYTAHTTPIHQDFVHFQGNFETYTCWSPIADCPIELGGLAVLPGSHKIDKVMDHHFSLGAGSLCINTDELDDNWHTTNYEVGDTLIFPALTVHKALPNLTEDRLRVSLDNRYTAIGSIVSDHMLEPHLNIFNHLKWEDVYRDWESDELKYYWENLDLTIVPRDFSYSNTGFDEALNLAQTGDERAKIHLSRIIKRDPSTEQAQQAAAVLKELAV